MYQVQEVAKISGVSVRTLHYYDEVGLLCPHKADNGYRLYEDSHLCELQLILYYKFLGFPLKEIKELMKDNASLRLDKLRSQLTLLKKEEKKIKKLVKVLEKTIAEETGGRKMSAEEKFEGFTLEEHKKHKKETALKYGEKVVEEAEKKQVGKEEEMINVFNRIFFAFAENKSKGLLPGSDESKAIAERLHNAICTYGFACSKDVFASIGKGYVADKRFKENIDRFGDGVAQYIFDAISSYVKS